MYSKTCRNIGLLLTTEIFQFLRNSTVILVIVSFVCRLEIMLKLKYKNELWSYFLVSYGFIFLCYILYGSTLQYIDLVIQGARSPKRRFSVAESYQQTQYAKMIGMNMFLEKGEIAFLLYLILFLLK